MNKVMAVAPNCPCMGCTERKLGCHGLCEKYAEWHKEQVQITKKVRMIACENAWGTDWMDSAKRSKR